ncbi:MAG TPA: hypothetical protein ENN99_00675 [Chloroflexi bacterium]|nr:hypothetical protein [Chloroflexota bacterium]
MIDTAADLRQEQTADYRIFELSGNHYTIGYQMGIATDLRPVENWRDRETELAFARACADELARFHPALLDEFRGYAAAQGRPWEEVLPHVSNNLPEGVLPGCTTFALRLPDGHVLIGRNHDFLYSRRERYLRRLFPTGYLASLGTQAGFIGSCYDGVNQYGLFVSVHTIRAQIAERVLPGLPPYLIPRILLETCRTAQEAAVQMQEMSFLSPFNYLIADPQDMIAAETYPGRVHIYRPQGTGLVITNYYRSPDMRSFHGRRNLTDHVERAQWIEARIGRDSPRDAAAGWAWAQELLRDHSVPVCHHQPNQATFWSLVADLTARRVAYCLGAPCRNPYQEHPWPENNAPQTT